MSPTPNNNQTKIPSKPIDRDNIVMSIGDLHGNIDALFSNLKSLNLIDGSKTWIGKDTYLVFHGDILADRYTKGIEILKEISKLKTQANEAGGKITVLVGNHDDFALSFLLDKEVAGGGTALNYGYQALGLSEFKIFIDPQINTNNLVVQDMYGLDRVTILNNMRNSQTGRVILQTLCSMKIIEQIDDTLFTHTDITTKMARYIIEIGIDKINSIYQATVYNVLFKDQKMLPENFLDITNTFLNTYNRQYFTALEAFQLKKLGINNIIHGHTNHNGIPQIIGDILVVSVDLSAFKTPKYYNKRSIGIIMRNGTIKIGETKEIIKV